MPRNFLSLPPELSDYPEAQYVVVPVAYDLTSTFVSGSRFGPKAIIEASPHIELYDEELNCEPYRQGIHTHEAIEPVSHDPQDTLNRIVSVFLSIIRDAKFPLLIGGEHTITVGAIKALKQHHSQFAVLYFDAHSDFRQEYKGSRFNHACVARRIVETGIPVVQVGIRAISTEEAEALKESQVVCLTMWELQKRSTEQIIAAILPALPQKLFISIDVDVFDPGIMPATGVPEPGGLGWYDMLKILRPVISNKTILGADVTELCPVPGLVAPNLLAARLVYKIIGYHCCASAKAS